MKTQSNSKSNATDLNQLIHQAATQHHPIKLHSAADDADVVLISKADLDTAQAVIKAATGRNVPFLIA